MEQKIYEYDGIIHEIPENGGAYVIFPWNIREEFGKGRVKVHAEFDGIPYDGSIVNMGVKDDNGNVCYLIGVLKVIRKQLKKGDGDSIHVKIWKRWAPYTRAIQKSQSREQSIDEIDDDKQICSTIE